MPELHAVGRASSGVVIYQDSLGTYRDCYGTIYTKSIDSAGVVAFTRSRFGKSF